MSTLQRIIRGHKPGDVVDLDVMRFGQKKTFKVKLAEPPTDTKVAANDEEGSAPVRPTASTGRQNDKLGITVDAIPAEFLQESRLQQQYRSGLYVSAVSGRGPAFRSLFQSDIILKEMAPSQRDIHTAEDLQAAVASAQERRRRSVQGLREPGSEGGQLPDAHRQHPGSITEF